MGNTTIKWGILGCGNIANKFAHGLLELSEAEITAVASRSAEKAADFGNKFRAQSSYGSYQELVYDVKVDVIYIATPHNFHKEHTLLCLENGKHVLCEKPLTTCAADADTMISKSRGKNLFLMEAMWTRFLPLWMELKQKLADGLIGDIWLVQADFGFGSRLGDTGRHMDPNLAGGALLDVGIYPISLANWIFNDLPQKGSSAIKKTHSGVDASSTYFFDYGQGRQAMLSSTVTMNTRKEAVIVGSKGYLKIPNFWMADQVQVFIGNDEPYTLNYPYPSTGYQYEALEVMNCIKAGMNQSKIMPLQDSLSTLKIMDSFRKDWGLIYPWENTGDLESFFINQ